MYTKEVRDSPISSVQIVEVGARDGLQNAPEILTADAKLALIGALIDAGVRRLEVASFVNPKRTPRMADADAVIAGLPDRSDVSYIGLCLNLRGVERAIAIRDSGARGVDEVGCVIVASDTFGLRNQGQTIADGIRANSEMLALARAQGLVAQVTVAAAFGCPFEGEVPADRVVMLAELMAQAGAVEIAFADTIGVAVPAQAYALLARVHRAIGPSIRLRAHFHNTRNTGIANAWAAFEAGVRVFDSSIGGLGGCPFAPNATGNVATEDLAYLFKRSGVDTGIDLDGIIAVGRMLEAQFGRSLPTMVGKAGGFGSAPASW